MKKFLMLFLSIVLCGLFLGAPFGFIQKQSFANEVSSPAIKPLIILSSDENVLPAEKVDFTPLGENKEEMAGESWIPQKNGGNNIDDEVVFSASIEGLDSSKLYMKIWIYFPNARANDLMISLSDATGDNKIDWELTDLSTFLKKDYSKDFPGSDDMKFYSEGDTNPAPFGWNLLVLPFCKGTKTGEIVDGGALTVNKLQVKQDPSISISEKLYVYSIQFGSSEQDNIIVEEAQEYVRIEFSKDLSSLVNGDYYVNEYFNLPEISGDNNGIFRTVMFGDKDLLKDVDSRLFSINIVSNGTSNTYEYGSKLLMKNAEYTISFAIRQFAQGSFVTVGSTKLKVSSYGSGVWFVDGEVNMQVGNTQKLRYSIHDAFKGATIKFSSLDESVVEIVDVDRVQQIVTVKAKKAGQANIRIKVEDDRLLRYADDGAGTAEEDGLINDKLLINVSVVKDNSKTIKIVLWIAFGSVLVYFVYLIVSWIKKSRNIEVK